MTDVVADMSAAYATGAVKCFPTAIWRCRRRSGSAWQELLLPRSSDLTSMAGIVTGALKRRLERDKGSNS